MTETERFPVLSEMRDPTLRARVAEAVATVLARSPWHNLGEVPYNPDVPQYGLVDHTNNVAEASLFLGRLVARRYGIPVNEDLLIAAAVLHDVSKLLEYEPDGRGGVRKSAIGQQLAHPLAGMAFLQESGWPLELVHLVATHTAESRMLPRLVEGVLVRHVDVADADAMRLQAGLPLIMGRGR